MQITDNLSLTLELILVKFEEKKYKNCLFHVQIRNLICFSWKENMAWEDKTYKS